MADLRWWRLEVDSAGKVVSCVAVEPAIYENGPRWIYVLARDQKEAGRKAWNEYCRLRQQKRDASLRAQGRCQCGRVNDRLPKSKCSHCNARRKGYELRRRARLRGEDIPRPDRRIADAERRQAEVTAAAKTLTANARLEVLLEVQQAWEDSSTNGAFTRWLSQQIEAAGGVRRVG